MDALLCSLNERLGALCEVWGADAGGCNVAPLSDRWLSDLATLARLQDNEPNGSDLWRMIQEG